MKLRQVLLACAFVLCAAAAHAQTTTTTSLAWDYLNTTPTYLVSATSHVVTADGITVTGSITCSTNIAVPTTTTCSIVLPASAVTPMPHVYAVKLVAEGVERTTTATIDPSKGKQPGGIRVIVNVNVQVGP